MADEAATLAAFRASIRAFLTAYVAPQIDAWEDSRSMPAREVFREFGNRRLLGIEYSRELGGLGLDYRYKRILAEELGRLDCGGVGMAISVQTDMCTPAIAAYGTADCKEQFLLPAIAGTSIGAVALTDPDGGSDFSSIRTALRSRGQDFLLTGRKLYVTNGSVADFYVVLCRSRQHSAVAESLTLVVVPATAGGVTSAPYLNKLGNLCCDHAEVAFDDVLIPSWQVIGSEGLGFGIQAEQLIRERLIWAIMGTAQARRLLGLACNAARTRSAFGNAIIAHDEIAQRLVDMDIQLTMLDALLDRCVLEMPSAETLGKSVLTAKLTATRVWQEAADCLLQVRAGGGYLVNVIAQRAFRDARAASIAGGTSEILRRTLVGYLP